MPGDDSAASVPRQYPPYYPRYFTLTIRALLLGLFAAFMLVLSLAALADMVYLEFRGQEAPAKVVSVDRRILTVHLPAPADRDVVLREKEGRPRVGDTV